MRLIFKTTKYPVPHVPKLIGACVTIKMFGKRELVPSKDVWKQLISLKFEVTVSRDEQITKQLEEGIYMVTQTSMVEGIITNSSSINRMLKNRKSIRTNRMSSCKSI